MSPTCSITERSLSVDASALADAASFEAVIRERLLGGRTSREALEEGTWDAIDDEVRSLVVELRDVHLRSRAVKKRLARGVEVLNPQAYASQAARLRPVLAAVGNDLTGAFLEITGATYVRSIRVLAGESGPVGLDLVVQLDNGDACFPQQLFS